jgi:flagellar protein FliO/FliZ
MTIRPALTSVGAALLGWLLLAPAALAADGESTPLNLPSATPAKPAAVQTSSGGLVRTIVGLLVVIVVIYGLYWILKQVKSSKQDRASGHGLQPLASLPLGANRSLQLVRAGHEVVLVGVGEGGVTPIRTYSEEEARALGLIGGDDEPPAAGAAPAADPVPGGRRTLRDALGRGIEDLRRKTVIR